MYIWISHVCLLYMFYPLTQAAHFAVDKFITVSSEKVSSVTNMQYTGKCTWGVVTELYNSLVYKPIHALPHDTRPYTLLVTYQKSGVLNLLLG